MKLKHRLSLYAVTIFSFITLVISLLIYLSFNAQMEKKEKQTLESKTLLAAIFYLEQDELPLREHEDIKNKLLKTISRRNIIVYDARNHPSNGEMGLDPAIDLNFIELIRTNKSSSFETKNYFYNGLFYHDNQGDFVVITRESKESFNAQMQSLIQILITVSVLGILFIYLFSLYLGRIAYAPIINMIAHIKERDTRNFNEPLDVKKTYAEVDDLVHTYNHFVERIAQTFHVQKNFIDYVSHELRTPITALMGTLEVTDQKERSVSEYQETIVKLRQYTNDLQTTLDQMMLLSGAKTTFEFTKVRIDEVIWQVIENAILYHQARIEVDIQVQNTDLLIMDGNSQLLELAIGNLIENAIKYSENQPIKILLQEENERLVVSIVDKGIGIPETDISNIKQNFYRGQNTQHYQGKGIGLSMANIIFNLHRIEMQIESNEAGTTVHLVI